VIVRLKDLIERCIARARRGECANCDNRHACAVAKWQNLFGVAEPAAAGPGRGPAGGMGGGFAPLVAFLGQLAKGVEKQAARRPTPFRGEVEARLEPLLPTGGANIDAVAGAMGVSRQTLYRRLKEEGSTFEQLLDDLRHRLALRYIREGMSAKSAAYRLGFSDPAAFSRAFKRWTGRSPSETRSS
jgi:AraC-like DNA-binding protein